MSGTKILDSSGRRVISTDGTATVAGATADCPTCGCEPPIPPIVCASDEACDQFCAPGYRQESSQSRICGCPCGGNRAFPLAWSGTWTGWVLRTGVKLFNVPFSGRYSIITMASGTPDATECMDGTSTFHITDYDSDDTILGERDGTVTSDAIAVGGSCLPDQTITVVSNLTSPEVFGQIRVRVNGTVSGCEGGTVTPVDDNIDLSPSPTVSVGIVVVAPKCVDCFGVSLVNTAPGGSAICASEIDVEFEAGGISHFVPCLGGGTAWTGTDDIGGSASITNVGPSDGGLAGCCVPGQAPCGGTACWKLVFGVEGCKYTLYGTGVCPPTGAGAWSALGPEDPNPDCDSLGDDIALTDVTFGTDCP